MLVSDLPLGNPIRFTPTICHKALFAPTSMGFTLSGKKNRNSCSFENSKKNNCPMTKLSTISYKLLLLLAVAAGVATEVAAQKYSNEFLSIGIGARAQALGNAMVARADEVTATYWNPAGLVRIPQETGLQLGAMHAEWFAGVGKFDFLSATLPLGDGSKRLGLTAIRFGIDNIPNTLSLFGSDGSINYDNIVEFSAADYAFLGSYAQQVSRGSSDRRLLVGGNLKVVRRVIGTFADSWGFGLDAGMQYLLRNWNFGLVARDLTTTFNAWTVNFTDEEKLVLLQTGNALPDIQSTEITKPSFLFGVAHRIAFGSLAFTPELDLTVTTDGQRNTLLSADPLSVDAGFGIEADYKNAVFLRAGVDQFQQEVDFAGAKSWQMRPSLGVGLRLGAFHLDYAYTDLGDQRDTYSHVISIMLSLRKKEFGQ
jgi:hypothetical protein